LNFSLTDFAPTSSEVVLTLLSLPPSPVFVFSSHTCPFSRTVSSVLQKKIVEKNAALVMEDKDALEKLIPEVFELLNNNGLQNKLKQNISKLGVLNADEIIANQILDIIK
jgi:hypothetical protein